MVCILYVQAILILSAFFFWYHPYIPLCNLKNLLVPSLFISVFYMNMHLPIVVVGPKMLNVDNTVFLLL